VRDKNVILPSFLFGNKERSSFKKFSYVQHRLPSYSKMLPHPPPSRFSLWCVDSFFFWSSSACLTLCQRIDRQDQNEKFEQAKHSVPLSVEKEIVQERRERRTRRRASVQHDHLQSVLHCQPRNEERDNSDSTGGQDRREKGERIPAQERRGSVVWTDERVLEVAHRRNVEESHRDRQRESKYACQSVTVCVCTLKEYAMHKKKIKQNLTDTRERRQSEGENSFAFPPLPHLYLWVGGESNQFCCETQRTGMT